MAAHTSTASCPVPKQTKSGVFSDIPLSQATKEGFLSKLDRAKLRLFPRGGTVDNHCLLTSLLDSLEGRLSGEASQREEACSLCNTSASFGLLSMNCFWYRELSPLVIVGMAILF